MSNPYTKLPTTEPPLRPSLPWRCTSSLIMGVTGAISRCFYYGFNNMEVIGLEKFKETLDRRKDPESRERGLITGRRPRTRIYPTWLTYLCLYSIEPCQRVCQLIRRLLELFEIYHL